MEETGKIGYREVFTQKEYVKQMISNMINRFGDSVDVIAFEWLVYQITGSAAWAAVIFGVNNLPTVLLQPFAGALVEGMNKKRVMVVTDCIRGVITAGLVALYLTGNVTPWILMAFTLLNSTVEAFSLPAGMALVPKLLEEKYYEYGTSLSNTVSTVVQLLGMGAAGVIIGAFGIWVAILIDAVSFFGSAFIRSFIKIKETGLQKEKLNFDAYKKDLAGGVSYLKEAPVVRNFCLLAVVINGAVVPMNALQTPLVYEVMGQGSEMLSVLSVLLTLGMLTGSLIFPKLNERFSVRGNMIAGGMVIGVGTMAYTLGSFLRPFPWAVYLLAGVVSFLLGISVSVMSAVLSVQFMKAVQQEYLARVGAIFNASATAAMPVTSFLISGLAAKCSVTQIFIVSGVVLVLLFSYVGVRKVRLE